MKKAIWLYLSRKPTNPLTRATKITKITHIMRASNSSKDSARNMKMKATERRATNKPITSFGEWQRRDESRNEIYAPYMTWASVYNDNYRVIPKVLIWSKNGPSRNFRAANFCANGTWSACCSHHHLSTCPFSANSCWIFLTQVCFHTLCSCLSHSCTNFDVIHPL